MILVTDTDTIHAKVRVNIESLKLVSENTITNTITINKAYMSYSSNLIYNKLLINYSTLKLVHIL